MQKQPQLVAPKLGGWKPGRQSESHIAMFIDGRFSKITVTMFNKAGCR